MILLTATALAGVVDDAEDTPRDFTNEPATGIYRPEAQKKPPVATSGSLKNSVVGDGAVVRSSPSKRKRRAQRDKGKSRKGELETVAQDQKKEQDRRGSFPPVPGGRDTWPLLAIAVLLLVAAGGGGYYFYQQSEE